MATSSPCVVVSQAPPPRQDCAAAPHVCSGTARCVCWGVKRETDDMLPLSYVPGLFYTFARFNVRLRIRGVCSPFYLHLIPQLIPMCVLRHPPVGIKVGGSLETWCEWCVYGHGVSEWVSELEGNDAAEWRTSVCNVKKNVNTMC